MPNPFFPALRSNAGFSLIEVLVTSAIFGVVALGVVSLLSTMQSGVNNSKFRSDSDIVNEEMRSLLSNPEACRNTFQGLAANAGASHVIPQVRRFDNTAAYAVDQTYGDRSVTLRSMTLKDFVTGPTPTSAQMTLYNDLLTAKESSGSKIVLRTVHIGLTLDGSGNIAGCVSLARMSDGIWQRTPANLNNIFFATPVLIPPSAEGGRVGIGTGDPLTLLDVQGEGAGTTVPDYPVIRITNTNPGPSSFSALQTIAGNGAVAGRLGAGTNNGDPSVFMMTATAHPLTFATGDDVSGAAIEQMRITTNGAVGFGISRPVGWNLASPLKGTGSLHVHSATNQGVLVVSGVSDSGETYSSLNLIGTNSSNVLANSWSLVHKKLTGTPLEDAFVIARWKNNVMTSPFTIMDDGTVQVWGNTPAGNPMRVHNQAANGFSAIEFGFPGAASVGRNNTTGDAFLNSTGANAIVLSNRNNTLLRVLSSGDATLSGNFTATGTVTAGSDARLKMEFTPLDGEALARKLRGVRFVWRKDGRPDIGFIAQEVEKVAPELVVTAPDGFKSLKYGNITAILVEAFHSLESENQVLRSRIEDLSLRLQALEKKQ